MPQNQGVRSCAEQRLLGIEEPVSMYVQLLLSHQLLPSRCPPLSVSAISDVRGR